MYDRERRWIFVSLGDILAIEREAAEAARAEVRLCPRCGKETRDTIPSAAISDVPAARAEVAEPGDASAAFEAGRATGTVEGWADYTNQPDPMVALREQFVALAPPAVVSRIAVWRLLGGSDDDLPW